MKRTLVAAALIALAFFTRSSPDEMLNATVMVEAGDATGSGTAITKRHILTNYHVVTTQDKVTVTALVTEGSRVLPLRYSGKVVARDKARDLAVIEIDRKWVGQVARVAPERPRLRAGEDIWVSGAPLGKPVHLTRGEIRVVNDTFDRGKTRTISTSAFVVWGNSGGGLYRQTFWGWGRYELIGVPEALEIVPIGFGVVLPNYSYAIPIDTVRQFLAESGVAI